MLSKDRKTEIIDRFKKHDVDTGSPEVQIGILTERINVPALAAKVSGVNAEHNIVILSIGMDDGVKPGYEFTVYRGDKYVGKVIVDDVQKDHCSGYSKKELQSGDIAVGDDARTRW